ncbi:hypothetical protein Ngar_c05540 [Candidatus Nitrososphaera gargensis Ga9.2]|uniref:Uncharacterized protein n=1 Tax=Nitrososphaera gargensis (strain Ga9.2) TaxID=1237085 RepID=K0IHX0_NITGG|nr:hypothetical protein [Candidatus Nitrososphaera gargensis]AFU57497.1 hypothetical protein Ngar_c05540 [Candidatus Nitrososphaera gargensis Ga9.2]
MYAKLCNIEILSSYIKDVSVGDMLTVQALITNPLDWQHFYEKILTIKRGDKTDFTVVTGEGDRLVGTGDIVEVDKWSNSGHYGFKIKIDVKRQKSLTDRRIRGPGRTAKPAAEKPPAEPAEAEAPQFAPLAAAATTLVTPQDIASFREMLKGSITMDMA